MASSTLFFRICILIVCLFALGWLAGRFAWASIAASVIMLLPLIESRAGMIQVFKKIAGASASIGQGRREIPLQQNDSNLRNAYEGHGMSMKTWYLKWNKREEKCCEVWHYYQGTLIVKE
jgi:hypothetical protein